MATPCRPLWVRSMLGLSRTKINSGCAIVGGNVNCDPETMRSRASAAVGQPLSLAEYTVARYVASEVGSGTPEERVVVARAAINKAASAYPSEGISDAVVHLLLRRQSPGHANRGYYGPIHGPEGSAPYGRWASTSKDPTVQDIAIARFAFTPEAAAFSRGAYDQFGPDAARAILDYGDAEIERWIRRLAAKGDYWIGPVVGVNPRHTFLVAPRALTPTEAEQVTAAGVQATRSAAPSVPSLFCAAGTIPSEGTDTTKRFVIAVGSTVGALAVFLAYRFGKAYRPRR